MEPSDKELAKELTRKLYWALSSTLDLTRQQRSTTFTWAAQMADRVLQRHLPSLPPPVDTASSNGYHGQAEGRGGGRNDPSISKDPGSLPPPNMAAWEVEQRKMRERAWAHVLKARNGGSQLPIPANVFREVGHGGVDSSS